MIPIPSAAAAFLAGLVTFLAPCTLPLVPAYVGFLSGTTVGEAVVRRRRVLAAALLFVLGFSVVLVTLGSLAGLLGAAAGTARLVIQRVGGVIVILLGLGMLRIFRIGILRRTFRVRAPGIARLPPGPRAFLFGVILASGWTPCVGPILGTILFFAGSTATVGTGATLLAIYAAGLAVPFLLVALFFGQAAKIIARVSRLSRGIEIVAGLFLIFLGWLFLADRVGLFITGTYRAFDFINYDALYKFF